MQLAIGSDVVTIPVLDLPFSTMKGVFDDVSKSVERAGSQAFFVVDMKNSRFTQIVDYLIEDLRSNMIGLVYRDYLKNIHNYETVFRYADKDVAFVSLQVERFDENRENISTMHCLPFLTNDIYSVEIPAFGGPSKNRKKSGAPRLDRVKLFDRTTLQVNKIVSFVNLEHKLKTEYGDDVIVRDILENYREAEYDNDIRKIQTLTAFSKVDELKSSSAEFSNLQQFINQESSKDYISEKKTLGKALSQVAQPSLADAF
jgi:hypothetical protein